MTTSRAGPMIAISQPEHRDIAVLCQEVRSVAEVAALIMVVPLGVARVLIADMAGMGLVTVHGGVRQDNECPSWPYSRGFSVAYGASDAQPESGRSNDPPPGPRISAKIVIAGDSALARPHSWVRCRRSSRLQPRR